MWEGTGEDSHQVYQHHEQLPVHHQDSHNHPHHEEHHHDQHESDVGNDETSLGFVCVRARLVLTETGSLSPSAPTRTPLRNHPVITLKVSLDCDRPSDVVEATRTRVPSLDPHGQAVLVT